MCYLSACSLTHTASLSDGSYCTSVVLYVINDIADLFNKTLNVVYTPTM